MFQLEKHGGLKLWQFSEWQAQNIKHFVSSRVGGVSVGNYESLNLAAHVGDKEAAVQTNRYRLAEALQISRDSLCFAEQVHGTRVSLVSHLSQCQQAIPESDALISNTPGIMLIILTADCVPVLLYDPVKGAIAAIHAGWRGSVADIVGKTLAAMQAHFGTKPQEVLAAIGPCISGAVYEVGTEVSEAFYQAFGGVAKNFLHKPLHRPRPFLDLVEANHYCLEKSGVLPHNILRSGVCSFQNEALCFSARRQGIKSGRMASGIAL